MVLSNCEYVERNLRANLTDWNCISIWTNFDKHSQIVINTSKLSEKICVALIYTAIQQ